MATLLTFNLCHDNKQINKYFNRFFHLHESDKNHLSDAPWTFNVATFDHSCSNMAPQKLVSHVTCSRARMPDANENLGLPATEPTPPLGGSHIWLDIPALVEKEVGKDRKVECSWDSLVSGKELKGLVS